MDTRMSEEEMNMDSGQEDSTPSRPKRKRKQQIEGEKKRNCYKRWSEDEKLRLLEGLEMYGPKDLAKIGEVIGTRNRQEVMCAVKYWKTEAMRHSLKAINNSKKGRFTRKKCAPGHSFNKSSKSVDGIELWIDVLIKQLRRIGKDGLSCVSPTVKMISHFEALPTVEEADGIDFRELYLWLAEILAGQPMRSLSNKTSTFLDECTRQLTRLSVDCQWPKTKAAIDRIVDKLWIPQNIKSYSKTSDKPEGNIDNAMLALLNAPGINTIGIDLERFGNNQTV